MDAAFLVELVAMKQAVNDVKTTGVEKDGIPDTYTFIFSSLRVNGLCWFRGVNPPPSLLPSPPLPSPPPLICSPHKALEGKYGADSEVMKFCLEAVKGCIDEVCVCVCVCVCQFSLRNDVLSVQITSELLGLYEGKMLVQALVLQWKEMFASFHHLFL